MKKEDIILKGRYGGKTLLTPTDNPNVYRVEMDEEWKPIYVDFVKNNDDTETITALDFDGGPKLYVGTQINEKSIAAFRCEGTNYFIEFV